MIVLYRCLLLIQIIFYIYMKIVHIQKTLNGALVNNNNNRRTHKNGNQLAVMLSPFCCRCRDDKLFFSGVFRLFIYFSYLFPFCFAYYIVQLYFHLIYFHRIKTLLLLIFAINFHLFIYLSLRFVVNWIPFMLYFFCSSDSISEYFFFLFRAMCVTVVFSSSTVKRRKSSSLSKTK